MPLMEAVAGICGQPVQRTERVRGGDICLAYRVLLADGTSVFAKTLADSGELFTAEAASLRWLAAAGAPVPAVLGAGPDVLVLPWLTEAAATAQAAQALGRALAEAHLAGAPSFGADWAGFAGRLRVANTAAATWAEFYAETRIRPLTRQARDTGALDGAGVAVLGRLAERLPGLAGPPEPPARLHGDLWSGNLLWTVERAWLIDPAAYGGHRETDLAMLDLFGAPFLAELLAAYQERAPLADGWQERVGLHQLYPLLAHAVMFGGGYGARAVAVARRYA